MSLLCVRDLTVRFGGFRALDGVSFEVDRNALVGIIGANGAGKSTLFAAITGYLPTDGGSVTFAGKDLAGLAIHKRVRRGLARTFQVPREFSQLSVFDNMMVASPDQAGEKLSSLAFARRRVAGEEAKAAERVESLLRFLNLERVADSPAGVLSGGQKKLLELGRLLMLEPRCLLLDEPFAGVNPVLIGEISQRILELNRKGMAIVVIEHNLHELARLVPTIHAMDAGRVIARGTPGEVLDDEAVREAYMGGVL